MATHHHASAETTPLTALLATAVHTTAQLAVTGLIARVVYSKVGVANFKLLAGAKRSLQTEAQLSVTRIWVVISVALRSVVRHQLDTGELRPVG
jgi:hypothetical protein